MSEPMVPDANTATAHPTRALEDPLGLLVLVLYLILLALSGSLDHLVGVVAPTATLALAAPRLVALSTEATAEAAQLLGQGVADLYAADGEPTL